jgi:predicted DNA-binding protein (MmcQ/YjbR family)
MYLEDLRTYCISKAGVEETLPFDNDTLVFKVMGKMFALTSISQGKSVNLKCEPELAIELRERYHGVEAGWHMNKQHWNTVQLDADYTDQDLKTWIDNSYNLVVNSLTKKLKVELELMSKL